MPDNAARFLGFAFASADFLFELDPEGRIAFAMGAVKRVTGLEQGDVAGHSWREIVAAADHELVAALIGGLGAADRRGPLRVELAAAGERRLPKYGALSACRLPQLAPNISCVLSLSPVAAGAEAEPSGPHGLFDREGFVVATHQLLDTAQSAGMELNMELVELRGLQKLAALPDGEAETVMRRVSSAVRAESFHGEGAARLGEEQFAVLRDRLETPDYMLSRLEKAAQAAGADVEARSASLALEPEKPPLQTMRALRFALDTFIKDGAVSAGSVFQKVLENTVTQAAAFSRVVKEQQFKLVYQPVVELASGDLQHFEALVRLDGDNSPAGAIRMAEELELIQSLDMAVVKRVVAKLTSKGCSRLKLAANVSARSLTQPGFLAPMLKLTEGVDGIADRLIFEITESGALEDLDEANTAIQRIRQRGFAVCLDDFGTGSASISNLRALSVDAVKIDGQYVRDLGQSGRDNTLMKHLAQLCEELGIDSIAEMVETAETAAALKQIGVGSGQGWYFGRPTDEPAYERPTAVRARRMGESESWG